MAPMSSTIARVSRKSFSAGGTRGPECRDDRDGERDIGGHRDSPSSRAWASGVHGEEQKGWHDHSTARREHGKCGCTGVAQLAGYELTLDLEPGDEEEQGHQAVADPVAEALGDTDATRSKGELVRPHSGVRVAA